MMTTSQFDQTFQQAFQTVPSEKPLTVAQLVRQAQAGDRDAFGVLFDRYRDAIVRLAMARMRNQEAAEDLAQDVFIQAMQKINQLRVPEAFGGWLKRIVYRMAVNRIVRGDKSVACDPETLQANCIDWQTPDQAVDRQEVADGIQKGIARLNDMDQQTLKAFYIKGQSLIEMADAFEAPIGTIKRRLHTARKRLAAVL